MKFSEEILTSELIKEVEPLLLKHWQEIATFKDIPLDPDYDMYLHMQSKGHLKTYTIRDGNGTLIGYAVFLLKLHHHYKKTLYALQDIVFVDPSRRGAGLYLIKWCEEQLKLIGVQVIQHHIKLTHDWSASLERLGYNRQEIIMTKRIA